MMSGGLSNVKAPTAEEQALLLTVKNDVESRMRREFTKAFNVVSYGTQVVAGTVYLMKVQCDDEILHIKIFKPLPHTGNPPEVMHVIEGVTLESPLVLP